MGLELICWRRPRGLSNRSLPLRAAEADPARASVVLTVENLRPGSRATRLALEEFPKLPTVKAWFDSEKSNSSRPHATRSRASSRPSSPRSATRLSAMPWYSPCDCLRTRLLIPVTRGILALKAINALGLLARQGETAGACLRNPGTGRAATKPPPHNHGGPVPLFAGHMGLSSKFNVKRSEFLRLKGVGGPSTACHSHDKALFELSNLFLCHPWLAFVP